MKKKNILLYISRIITLQDIRKVLTEVIESCKNKNKIYCIYLQCIEDNTRLLNITKAIYITKDSISVDYAIEIINIDYQDFIIRYLYIQKIYFRIIGREYLSDNKFISIRDSTIRRQVITQLFKIKEKEFYSNFENNKINNTVKIIENYIKITSKKISNIKFIYNNINYLRNDYYTNTNLQNFVTKIGRAHV